MVEPNAHDIFFDNLAHEVRYSHHIRCKLTPTRYMCSQTLSQLGLTDEVYRMLHVLGILEFMQHETPTFERITLEFLSSIECKLKPTWDGITQMHTGTLTFRLFNVERHLTLEELGGILHLPVFGPKVIPETFNPAGLWGEITGCGGYEAKSAKASHI